MNKNKTKNNYNNGKKEEFLYKSSDNDIDISEEYKKGYKLYIFVALTNFPKNIYVGCKIYTENLHAN